MTIFSQLQERESSPYVCSLIPFVYLKFPKSNPKSNLSVPSLPAAPCVRTSSTWRCAPALSFCSCFLPTSCLSRFTDSTDPSHFLFSTTESQTSNFSPKGTLKATMLRRSPSADEVVRQTPWGNGRQHQGAPLPILSRIWFHIESHLRYD